MDKQGPIFVSDHPNNDSTTSRIQKFHQAVFAQPPSKASPANTPAVGQAPNQNTYPGQLVYKSQNDGIFLINPDGTGRRKLAEGSSPVLSADGKRLAFVYRTGPPTAKGRGAAPMVN